ncbi:hypothetical protein [Caulobacter sp.]|uniref:hypothetical protein n=1 Tax=Caulobacter sp. TaxID=78 RepID=UPI003BAC094D
MVEGVAALVEGRRKAIEKPGPAPAGIESDLVGAYPKDIGAVVVQAKARDLGNVAGDVWAVLDRQYSLEMADGAAISLNRDGLFSDHEVTEAASEIRP